MLKVFFLVSNDHLFHPTMMDELLKSNVCLPTGIGLVTRGNQHLQKHPMRQFAWNLRFWGIRGCLKLLLLLAQRLVLSHLPGNRTVFWSVSAVAKRHGIKSWEVRDVNDGALVRFLRSSEVDVLFVACPQILGKDILSAPRLCVLNKHSGKLPEYRGVLPVFYAMLNGEKHATLTLHTMTEKIDVGKVVTETAVPITTASTLLGIYFSLYSAVPAAFVRAMRLLDDPSFLEKQQPTQQGTYHSFPSRQQRMQFRRRHRMA